MTPFVVENKKTPETEKIERLFKEKGFEHVEAYRHSSASIRLRVRDERFRGLSRVDRMEMIEPIIEELPAEIQQDLIFVLPFAVGEEKTEFSQMNRDFEEPRSSRV